MYYLIGADGSFNGPLSVTEIHRWLAEGRATKYSRVRRQDEEEWRPLGSIPELAPAGPVPEPAVEAGPGAAVEPRAVIAGFVQRAAVLDAGRCLSRGWALVRANPVMLIGSALVAWSLIVGVALLPRVGWMLGLVVNAPLLGGLYSVYLGHIRHAEARPEDLFAGFRIAFVPLVLAGLLCSALTTLGFLLLIVPGIYLAVAYMFAVPLVIDKQLDVWTALEVSRQVVHRQWWMALALTLIVSLVVLAGLLAFGVGVFVAVPVATAALMYAYEDLFGRE